MASVATVDPAAAAALDRQPELARGRDPGLAGRDEVELLDFGAAFPQARPKHEIRQFLLRQSDTGERQVEVDRQCHRRQAPARHAGLELLPARREDEAVDVEPLAFELERDAGSSRRIVPPPLSRRLAPPSPASSASVSSSTVRPAVLNAVWIVTGIGRPAAATCAGGPKRILALPATPGVPAPPSPAESAILASISKRGWMSPPPVSFARMVRSAASSPVDETERHARRHAVDAPGSGEGLAFDAHVLDEDLVGAPGRRRDRGHEKLPDAQVLEGPVAPEQLAGGKIGRQTPGAVGAGRDADLGAAEAGLGEAHLAAQERRQGDLGLEPRPRQARASPAGWCRAGAGRR